MNPVVEGVSPGWRRGAESRRAAAPRRPRSRRSSTARAVGRRARARRRERLRWLMGNDRGGATQSSWHSLGARAVIVVTTAGNLNGSALTWRRWSCARPCCRHLSRVSAAAKLKAASGAPVAAREPRPAGADRRPAAPGVGRRTAPPHARCAGDLPARQGAGGRFMAGRRPWPGSCRTRRAGRRGRPRRRSRQGRHAAA